MKDTTIKSALLEVVVPAFLLLALLGGSFSIAAAEGEPMDPPPAIDSGDVLVDEGTENGDTPPENKEQFQDPSSTAVGGGNDDEIPANAELISDEDMRVLTGEDPAPALFFGGNPTIRIHKNLTQDNGGDEGYEDFTVTVQEYRRFLLIFWIPNGTETYTFDPEDNEFDIPADRAHRYIITEEADGYTTSYSDEEDECDFTFPILSSPTYVCTITNDDIAPSLTLVKEVAGEGELASPESWTLSAESQEPPPVEFQSPTLATEGPTYSISGFGTTTSDGTLQAGTYVLSESGGPEGYFAGSWSCTNDVTVGEGNTITLGVGETTTCTIVNTLVVPEDEPESRSAHSNPSGSVLGASTGPGEVLGASCPLITAYMREGRSNDSSQVTNLQNFLNDEMESGLAVTGIFDAATTAAVKAFQLKYWEEVLKPWAAFGLDEKSPTGFVYKTTVWKINSIACPELSLPFPTLP